MTQHSHTGIRERRGEDFRVLEEVLPLLANEPGTLHGIPRVFEASRDALGVLTVEHIEDHLHAGMLRYPFLGLVRDGRPLPVNEFTTTRRLATTEQGLYVDPQAVLRHFHEGATLSLRGLEQWHLPARELARRLADVVGAEVRATAFLTPPGAQGLALHRDEFHVFAIQCHGRKRWMLHGCPDDGNWRAGPVTDPVPDRAETVELTAGDVLFMECGTAHAAATADESSLHIGFAVHPLRVTAAVNHLLADALKSVGPEFLSLSGETAAGQLRSAVARVVERLSAADTRAAAHAVLAASSVSSRLPRPSFGITGSAGTA